MPDVVRDGTVDAAVLFGEETPEAAEQAMYLKGYPAATEDVLPAIKALNDKQRAALLEYCDCYSDPANLQKYVDELVIGYIRRSPSGNDSAAKELVLEELVKAQEYAMLMLGNDVFPFLVRYSLDEEPSWELRAVPATFEIDARGLCLNIDYLVDTLNNPEQTKNLLRGVEFVEQHRINAEHRSK